MILVTGAAGFIGAAVCERLLDDGYSVLGIDNLNDYYDPKLKLGPSKTSGILFSLAVSKIRYFTSSKHRSAF